MKNLKYILVSVAALSLSGCATVINGTSESYVVKTDPVGADVSFSNGISCTSPCKVELKRRHDLRADIKHQGYKPAYVLIQSRTGGAMAGNILLGGIIGGVIDGTNGSTNHLVPGPLNVKLAADGSADEARLLDKKDKLISTVLVHNDKVRADVAQTIGNAAAGLPVAPVASASIAVPAANAASVYTADAAVTVPAAPAATPALNTPHPAAPATPAIAAAAK